MGGEALLNGRSPRVSNGSGCKLGGELGGLPMRDPFSWNSFASPASRESWLVRIRDNFYHLLEPARIFPSSANGAPLHLLARKHAPIASAPRITSLLTHMGLVAAL